jgi:hypothetical protein
VRRAIVQLAEAWVRWFENVYRKTLFPTVTDNLDRTTEKFGRFVAWYTRAWVLVPSEIRKQCPDPRRFNDYEAQIAKAEIVRILDSLGANEDVKIIATQSLSEQAHQLMRELKETAQDAATSVGQAIAGAGIVYVIFNLLTRRSKS